MSEIQEVRAIVTADPASVRVALGELERKLNEVIRVLNELSRQVGVPSA
jgi:hypothetical protein